VRPPNVRVKELPIALYGHRNWQTWGPEGVKSNFPFWNDFTENRHSGVAQPSLQTL
jgi:hypothetical protein